MTHASIRRAHALSGGFALLTVLAFWLSTLAVELMGSPDAVVRVKETIPWGLVLLLPAMAATGISGMRLARNAGGRLVRRKLKRMRVAAALGLLVLVPCALYLGQTASADDLDATYYAVQGVELVAGACNITLLGLNARDGLRLTGRRRRFRTSLSHRPPVEGDVSRAEVRGTCTQHSGTGSPSSRVHLGQQRLEPH